MGTAEQPYGMSLMDDRPKLGQLMVQRGIITPSELAIALELQGLLRSSTGPSQPLKGTNSEEDRYKLGQLLVERGIVAPKELAVMLGLQLGVPYIDPNTYQIQPQALELISEATAREHKVMPLAVGDDSLQVAIADANDASTLQQLATGIGLKIEPVVAAPEEIETAIESNYGAAGELVDQSIDNTVPAPPGEERITQATVEALKNIGLVDDGEGLRPTPEEQDFATDEEATVSSDMLQDIASLNLNTCNIDPKALQLISEATARKYNVIPLAINNGTLHVGMADANDIFALQELNAQTRMRIEPVIATREEIQRAIDRNYRAYGEIEQQFNTTLASSPSAVGGSTVDAVAGAPVVRALDLIVDEAIKSRASDIHIEPEEDRLRLRYRIDGMLHEVASLPINAHAPLISRLKILTNMNIADHLRPQDGQFSVKAMGREVDIRVATVPTAHGEMGVLRVLDKSFAALSLGDVGFSPENLEQFKNMLKSLYGMILISGPTGSGKTTTLYASVSSLDCTGRNIITIEDPVEYRFKGINQIQVNTRTGLTFAAGLRAIMRHDPDVILVGEIRDPETAEIAVQAALTGHLVLASVHANDAVGSLFRLIDLGVPPFLVSSGLIGCIAQRMVRRICHHCRRQTRAPVEAKLAYCKEMGEERTKFYYGSGCNSCTHTGYLGRVAVFEILHVSDEIRKALLAGASAGQIRDQAVKEGLVSMWHDGMLKVKAGVTTPCEVLRSVFALG